MPSNNCKYTPDQGTGEREPSAEERASGGTGKRERRKNVRQPL